MAVTSNMKLACSSSLLKPLQYFEFPTQDLRRFARSPASVFNPGASLADTFRAERRTGVVFPDEARASFVYFDGQARSSWLRSEASDAWRGGVMRSDLRRAAWLSLAVASGYIHTIRRNGCPSFVFPLGRTAVMLMLVLMVTLGSPCSTFYLVLYSRSS